MLGIDSVKCTFSVLKITGIDCILQAKFRQRLRAIIRNNIQTRSKASRNQTRLLRIFRHQLFFPFRHRIISAGTPRMAAGDSLHAEPDAFYRTPFRDGIDRVLRT